MKKLHFGLAVIGTAAAAALVASAGSSSAATPAATTTVAPAVYTESGAWASYSAAGGTVAHLNLPAGHYLASAQVVINVPHASIPISLACLINGLGDYRGLLQLPAGASPEMTTIPVEHAITLGKAQTVRVTCSANKPFQAGATVTAIPVSVIHQQ